MSLAINIHRFLKIVAFNANGIFGRRFGVSKQLEAKRIDVALLSETHVKTHERFSVRNYHIYWTNRHHACR